MAIGNRVGGERREVRKKPIRFRILMEMIHVNENEIC